MNLISLLLITFFVHTATAQEVKEPVFTVNLGTSVSISDKTELAPLRKLGFLYALDGKDGYKSMNIGGYNDRAQAEAIAKKVVEVGYITAVVKKIKVVEDIFTIQLGIENNKKPINWKKYPTDGELFVYIDNDQLKITYGKYEMYNEAKKVLAKLKKEGFKEAWVKAYNKALLRKLTEFEMGGYKRPFVDISTFEPSEKDVILAKKTPDMKSPKAVEVVATKTKLVTVPADYKAKAKPKVVKSNLPKIRGKISRTSSESLQSVLKKLGYYKGRVDGYYGPGTRGSFEAAYKANNQLKKYKLLLKSQKKEKTEAKDEMQRFIKNLSWNTADAVTGLGKYDDAIALAFRAYGKFLLKADSKEINTLMNKALKKAFHKKKSSLPYDGSATYAYENDAQLIRHIVWIFMTDSKGKAMPCWMLQNYTKEIKAALSQGDALHSKIKYENCGGFQNWEIVQVMTEMAKELNGNRKLNTAKLEADRSKLAESYLLSVGIDDKQQKANKNWEANVMKNMTKWGELDDYLDEIATAFKLTYYQTKVLLEDYYMDNGMKDKDAERSAQNALRLMTENYLTRFKKTK